MDTPGTGRDLDNAKKHLTNLNYTHPDTVIQHSVSLLQDFNDFKLQLSTIEKNSIEYQIAQLSGPGFTPLQTGGISYLMHLWLDRGYPLQIPELTLTDFAIPMQYLQPFYNPDTSKVEYSIFYDWNSESSLTELLLAVNKVLAHTSIAWLYQMTPQQYTPAFHNQIMNLNPQAGYPIGPNISNGIAPHLHQSLNRFPITKSIFTPIEKPEPSHQSKHRFKDSRRRGSRHNHKARQIDVISDTEKPKEQNLEVLDLPQKQASSSITIVAGNKPKPVKIASNEGAISLPLELPINTQKENIVSDQDANSTSKATSVVTIQSKQGEIPSKPEKPIKTQTDPPLQSKHVKKENTAFLHKKLDPPMNQYIPQSAVEEGLNTGLYIKGPFRINQKNYEQGYVYNAQEERDVIILGVANRNRAMPMDIVVVELLEEAYYQSNTDTNTPPSFQDLEHNKIGRVVFISQLKHSRKTVGFLKAYDTQHGVVLFSPRDSRIPRLLVPLEQCPKDYVDDKRKYDSSIFAAEITDWKVDSPYANGKLIDCLGDASKLEIQIVALLIENDITQDNTFPKESIDCLPIQDWSISADEYESRRDYTKECIYTIDPATARDMDDALHCRKIDDNTFEVGVHIADVSYFVKENSPLDLESKKRGTSVYLTHKVIRMLPEVLADKLCSLNPNVERLAFSVVFKMNESCEPFDIWYGRSIIRSCIKMHYELAAEIIQKPSKQLEEELEEKVQGQSVKDVMDSVQNLNFLACKLRDLRIKDGSLILQKIILSFSIDPDTGHPIGYGPYTRHASHFLIEEFMLLANKLVAQKLAEHFPEHAILRLHPPPNQHQLENKLQKVCTNHGIDIDISSAGGIMKTLHAFQENHDADEICILSNLCSIPMNLAKYFRLKDGVNSLHYALNFHLYTHFTSPIRRYPDLMVHRQLAAAIGQGPALTIAELDYDIVTEECNESKANAKKASLMCNQLFFAYFLFNTGPIEEDGRIMKVLDCSFDVMLTRIGIEVRVYCEKIIQEGIAVKFVFNEAAFPQSITITWKIGEGKTFDEDLKMFSPVRVRVFCVSKEFKLEAMCMAASLPKAQV